MKITIPLSPASTRLYLPKIAPAFKSISSTSAASLATASLAAISKKALIGALLASSLSISRIFPSRALSAEKSMYSLSVAVLLFKACTGILC